MSGAGAVHVADVVVVGCGAAGSAAAWHCARRGLRVVALDRFEPGHRRGSSHGTERIVRLGHTDEAYLRFALDALAGWDELEQVGRVPLLSRTGSLDVGFQDELDEIEAACRGAGVAVERWSEAEVRRRHPGVAFTGEVLRYEAGGTVHADRSLSVLRRLAAASGAELRMCTGVDAIEQHDAGDGVTVVAGGERWRVGTAIVTTGAWAPVTLAGVLDLPGHRVTKEQLAFFRPRDGRAGHEFPTFIVRAFPRHYGMVTPEGLVKVAEHHTGPEVDPDTRGFELEPVTWARLCEWVAEFLPGVDPEPVDSSTCLYASTPDEDFVLDRIGDVVVGAGLSGHGFKFVPEIGRRLADLADGTGWAGNPFAVVRTPRSVGSSGHK